MSGAKSALEVKDGLNFLDLIVRQIEHLNVTNNVDVPLILMTSFNTHGDTLLTANKHVVRRVCIKTVEQSRYPRVGEDSRLPCPKTAAADEKKGWYPPGHGELYEALTRSGMLDQLLSEGKEYLFVSNSDNLGAVLVSCLCAETVSFFVHMYIFLISTTFHFKTAWIRRSSSIWSILGLNLSWRLLTRRRRTSKWVISAW